MELTNDEELIKAEEMLKVAKGLKKVSGNHLYTFTHRNLCNRSSRYSCMSVESLSRSSFIRVRAARIPFQASRSTLSSWSPRLVCDEPSDGSPTPREGGTNPRGGALMAEGAMRE